MIARTIKQIIPTIDIINKSWDEIVKMLPKSIEFTFAVVFPELINMIAMPRLSVRTIDITSSAYFLKYPLKLSITIAHNDVKMKEDKIGFIPITKPIATPAKEEWDSVSPSMELRLSTINKPIIGQRIETIAPAITAFVIKSY